MSAPIKTGDVFVPGKAPTYTYNPRDELQLEERLRDYLEDGGSVLALVGPTKTGKSVLLKRVLDDPIWIDGQGIKAADDLWVLIGSEIGVTVEVESVDTSGTASTASVRGKAIFVEGGGDITASSGKSKTTRVLAAIGPAVKDGLLASGRTLVIDDFHFIERGTQQEIVRAVKPLVFDGLRVVFAAISHRRHDVVTAVEDMVGRVTPLEISLWTEDELKFIAAKGFERLNVVDRGDRLGAKLAEMSFGSPHIMQKLCRELVRAENGVREAQPLAHDLSAPADWDEFFRTQVDDASGRWFTKLLRGPQEKGQKRATWALNGGGATLDSYGLVLKAVSDTGPKLELTRDEIRAGVEHNITGKPPEANQVTRALQHMSRIAAKRLEDVQPSEEDLDAEPVEFAGVQPVLEFIEDGPASTLHIADPFFAYYLRWGADRHLAP